MGSGLSAEAPNSLSSPSYFGAEQFRKNLALTLEDECLDDDARMNALSDVLRGSLNIREQKSGDFCSAQAEGSWSYFFVHLGDFLRSLWSKHLKEKKV